MNIIKKIKTFSDIVVYLCQGLKIPTQILERFSFFRKCGEQISLYSSILLPTLISLKNFFVNLKIHVCSVRHYKQQKQKFSK